MLASPRGEHLLQMRGAKAARRLAKAAAIMGIASVAELAAFGVTGSPFAAALGIGARAIARISQTHRIAQRNLPHGIRHGAFRPYRPIFSAPVAAALML